MNRFPGTEIKIDSDCANAIIRNIKALINPNNLESIDVVRTWSKISKDELFDDQCFWRNRVFYLYYEHPMHIYHNKLFQVNANLLGEFLEVEIEPEKYEGVDVIIVDKKFSTAFVCNHDGDIFLV